MAPKLKNSVLILDGLDFIWDEPELKKLANMWNEDISIVNMANYFERDQNEVLLAIIHLAIEGKISKRKLGLS